MTTALGEVLHRPTFLPVPRFGPKILLGGEVTETFLYASQRVYPRVLEADGFPFTPSRPRSGPARPTPRLRVASPCHV